MINGGTNNGKSEGNVDCPAKTEVLNYRQALVMIHGQNHITLC